MPGILVANCCCGGGGGICPDGCACDLCAAWNWDPDDQTGEDGCLTIYGWQCAGGDRAYTLSIPMRLNVSGQCCPAWAGSCHHTSGETWNPRVVQIGCDPDSGQWYLTVQVDCCNNPDFFGAVTVLATSLSCPTITFPGGTAVTGIITCGTSFTSAVFTAGAGASCSCGVVVIPSPVAVPAPVFPPPTPIGGSDTTPSPVPVPPPTIPPPPIGGGGSAAPPPIGVPAPTLPAPEPKGDADTSPPPIAEPPPTIPPPTVCVCNTPSCVSCCLPACVTAHFTGRAGTPCAGLDVTVEGCWMEDVDAAFTDPSTSGPGYVFEFDYGGHHHVVAALLGEPCPTSPPWFIPRETGGVADGGTFGSGYEVYPCDDPDDEGHFEFSYDTTTLCGGFNGVVDVVTEGVPCP
jgi:hypothetical protein